MQKLDGLQAFEQPLIPLPPTLRQLILERIQNRGNIIGGYLLTLNHSFVRME